VKISIVAAAENELIEAAGFYTQQAGTELGLAFIAEFERAIALLRSQPALGAPWRVAYRRMPMRRSPYSVVYALFLDEVRVLAVAHQRRRPGYWHGRH